MNDKELDAKYTELLKSFGDDVLSLTEDAKILKFLWNRFAVFKINEEDFFSWVKWKYDDASVLKYYSFLYKYHKINKAADIKYSKFLESFGDDVLSLTEDAKILKFLWNKFIKHQISEQVLFAWVERKRNHETVQKYLSSLSRYSRLNKAADIKYSRFLEKIGDDFLSLNEDANILKFLWNKFVRQKVNEEEFFSWLIKRNDNDTSSLLKYVRLVCAYHGVIIIPHTTMYDVLVSLGELVSYFPKAKKFMSQIDQRFEKFMADIEQRVLTLPIGEEVFKKYLEKVLRNYAIDEERFLAWIKVNKDKSDYIKYFYSLLVWGGFISTLDRRRIAGREILLSIRDTYPSAEVLLEHLNIEFIEFLKVIENDFVQLNPDKKVFAGFLTEMFRKRDVYDDHFFLWLFENIDISYFAKYLCAVVIIYEVRKCLTKVDAKAKLEEIKADYPPALFILGRIYHSGIVGTIKSYTQAFDCFKKASEKGVLRANYELIRYYFGLFNVPYNIEKARFYRNKALKLGGNKANYIYGVCIVEQVTPPSDQEFEQGLNYIKKEAENGYRDALEFFRKKQYETGNYGAKVKEFLERPDNSELKNEVAYREAYILLFSDPDCLSQDSYDLKAVTILQGLRGHRKSVSLLAWCLQNEVGLKGYKSESINDKKGICYFLEAHRLLLEISTNSKGAVLTMASSSIPEAVATNVVAYNAGLMIGSTLALPSNPDLAPAR